jgi:phosphomannomutase/phosphoglucomutase
VIEQSIFRAYDIRGVVDKGLTEEAVELVGQAFGSLVRERGGQEVAIGRDGRLSGPRFAAALTRGLNSVGCDVVNVGMVPTPLVYFATFQTSAKSCIAITGSHNPPEYNGLKMVCEGETLSGEMIQGLYQRILAGNFATGSGGSRELDVKADYIARIVSDVKLAKPIKAVVDCGNGVAGAVAPALLRALGVEFDELFCEVDGTFPNHHPDPSKPENLQDLIAKVKETGADIGLAFDGDGDRLGVVDNAGHVIFADRLMMLFAQDVLSRNPGGEIIFDVKCTAKLPQVIEAAGGRATMWRTGHSFIKAKLRETGALLAGEMSGHTFFKERWYGFDDGLYTMARLLEIVTKDARTSEQIFAALPDTVNTPELNIKFAEGEHYAFMDKILAVAQFDDAKVTTLDGIRVDFAEGWGLIRASNTTPVLVLRFDADSQPALDAIQSRFKALLNQVDANLDLPF